MSPGSKVKSEYMKRYKDPRWDMYGPCYRELLHYRLSRRLLEQAHNPWFWDDWGPASSSDDSSSGGGGSPCPAPQGAPASSPPPSPPRSAVLELEASEDADAGAAGLSDPEKRRGKDVDTSLKATFEQHKDLGPHAEVEELPMREVEEKPEQQIKTKETDKLPSGVEPRQQPSALFARGNRKTAKSPQRLPSKIRENKHPFALYGWGEKQTDTGSQKTHNVCASAPMHEIHESALRAKNRRQVEKRKLVAQRQRAHSVDVEKNRRIKPSSSDNPWMTEYMRCYSARA
ncbi:centriole, cilia and spindle-associated protein [Trichechus inunguis]|uniref:Centriole, cilia and spindle-associated protein n=1 Tax=Trichechus manatus latirostris TaxID=127582 RepID=A0A2Y9RIJ3_TRIMA|nr:centriole, cilia and spindle-associated protein [Trichechus manatus latirostris]